MMFEFVFTLLSCPSLGMNEMLSEIHMGCFYCYMNTSFAPKFRRIFLETESLHLQTESLQTQSLLISGLTEREIVLL